MDLLKNLIGCLVVGVFVFGVAIFREVEVEGHSTSSAVAVGLVVGGAIAATLGVLVVAFWRRDRRSESSRRQE